MKQIMMWIMVAGCTFVSAGSADAKPYSLSSPNGAIDITIQADETLMYMFSYNERKIAESSNISMTLDRGRVLGLNPVVAETSSGTVAKTITPLYGIRSRIPDHYNWLRLDFAGGYAIEIRAYDDGWGYRFVTDFENDIVVNNEGFEMNLAGDFDLHVSFPRVDFFLGDDHWITGYEDYYQTLPVTKLGERHSVLPITIEAGENAKIGFTESDVLDYASMQVRGDAGNAQKLVGDLPGYPIDLQPAGYRNWITTPNGREDYIAKTDGSRTFPWRVFICAPDDKGLLASDLVYRFASPPAADMDFSWVQPGKVAWDWWSNINVFGVDFEAGFNTETFKYYIDFAAAHDIEYINLDDTWYHDGDIMSLVEDIDFPELMAYAKRKDVKVILWCVGRYLEAKLDEALDRFEQWGIAGLKIDFFERDDQQCNNRLENLAKACAERKLAVNFHGVTKPTGFSRTYPNVINREGVKGLEYNKFSQDGYFTPEHAVEIPFTRMLAGYMDVTPGALINNPEESFKVIFDLPMSWGTRCQQIAMYVVYYAPLVMLCDSPTLYWEESDMMDFISAVPVTWDETLPLAGKIGDYALIARRSGETWYIGGLTDENARNLELDFSFLGDGLYEADIYTDGANAHRNGVDYRRVKQPVTKSSNMTFHLAPAGGVAIKITPKL